MAADNIFCQHTLSNWPSFAISSLPYNSNNYLSVHELASVGLHADVKYLMPPPLLPPELYLKQQQQQLELLAYSMASSNNNNSGTWRNPSNAPIRKLSVDLIRTYKHINEVSIFHLLCALYILRVDAFVLRFE